MDCREAEERLQDRIDDRLDEETARALQVHLDGCPECATRLSELRRVVALVRELPRESAPADFASGVRERVRGRRPAGRRLELPLSVIGIAAAAAVLLIAVVMFVPGPGRRGQGPGPETTVADNKSPDPVRESLADDAPADEFRREAVGRDGMLSRRAELPGEPSAKASEFEILAKERSERRTALEAVDRLDDRREGDLVLRETPPRSEGAPPVSGPKPDGAGAIGDLDESRRRAAAEGLARLAEKAGEADAPDSPEAEEVAKDAVPSVLLAVVVSDPDSVAARVRVLVDPENAKILARLGMFRDARVGDALSGADGGGGSAVGGGASSGPRRLSDRVAEGGGSASGDDSSVAPGKPAPLGETRSGERGKAKSPEAASAPEPVKKDGGRTGRVVGARTRPPVEIALSSAQVRRLVTVLEFQVAEGGRVAVAAEAKAEDAARGMKARRAYASVLFNPDDAKKLLSQLRATTGSTGTAALRIRLLSTPSAGPGPTGR